MYIGCFIEQQMMFELTTNFEWSPKLVVLLHCMRAKIVVTSFNVCIAIVNGQVCFSFLTIVPKVANVVQFTDEPKS
jgi:hypothetical protein